MVKSTKPAKKAPTKPGKPITDFFARIPAASQSSTVSDTASSRTRSKAVALSSCSQTAPAVSPQRPAVAALKSSSASNSRQDKPTPRAPRSPTKPMETRSRQARTASLKRPRSPDATRASTSAPKPAGNPPAQPVEIAPMSTPRKKARISPSGSPSRLSDLSVVPSSQSDEEELSMPTTSSTVAVNETVKSWRKQTAPLTPHSVDDSEPMDVEDTRPVSSSPTTIPWDEEESTTSFSASSHVLTPPYTDRASDEPPIPPTPVKLDPATKADQMVEDIRARARARAAALFSNDRMDQDIPEEEEDDSDDDMSVLFARKASVGPSSSPPTSEAPQLRRSNRQRPSLGVSSTGSPISRRSHSPSGSSAGKRPSTRTKARPNATINKLLKEKNIAEKKGAGADTFLKAESIANAKSVMIDEMSDEGDEVDYESLRKGIVPLSFGVDPNDKPVENFFLDEADRKDLFGSGEDNEDGYDGKDINSILKSDQAAREAAAKEAEKKQEGVPLWTASSDDMTIDTEPSIPRLASTGGSATMQMLNQAMERQDFARATWILKSGALTGLAAADQPSIISDLCVLATTCSLHESPLSAAALNVALNMLDPSAKKPMSSLLSNSFIIRSIVELGAAPSHLQSLGVKVDPTPQWPNVNAQLRERVLYRVVALTTKAASARRLIAEELPDTIVALAAVALDPSTSIDLRRDVTVALNHLCRAVSPVNHSDRDAESVVAARLVSTAQTYEPVNKSALVMLFASGTGATMRIARFVSYSILVSYPSSSITGKTYCDPAPLSPLLNQLLQPKKSAEGETPSETTLFAVTDDTDYVGMKFYANLLGIATSNVKGWVELEKAKKKPSGFAKQDEKTDLDLLHTLLEELHSSINDLRAAHLDRSRTKATVKQIQMRIYYQRLAFERAVKAANAKAGEAIMKNWLAKASGSS